MAGSSPTYEDHFEEGIMNLSGCSGFALDVEDTRTKLAYIEPAKEEQPRTAGFNPYKLNYKIRLQTFPVLDDALAYLKKHVVGGLDLNFPKCLKLCIGSGIEKNKEKIEATLGFECEDLTTVEDDDRARSVGDGVLYGVTKHGKKFFQNLVYSPAKGTPAQDREKYKADVANYQAKMDAEPEEQEPEPDDCERVWDLQEKHQKECLPSLAVSMDESKFTLVLGENDNKDIEIEKAASDRTQTVSQALKIAREKQVKTIFFYGDFCRDNKHATEELLKKLPMQDMENIGCALATGVVKHASYLKVLGCLMGKVHFMRLLMICPCPDSPPPTVKIGEPID